MLTRKKEVRERRLTGLIELMKESKKDREQKLIARYPTPSRLVGRAGGGPNQVFSYKLQVGFKCNKRGHVYALFLLSIKKERSA